MNANEKTRNGLNKNAAAEVRGWTRVSRKPRSTPAERARVCSETIHGGTPIGLQQSSISGGSADSGRAFRAALAPVLRACPPGSARSETRLPAGGGAELGGVGDEQRLVDRADAGGVDVDLDRTAGQRRRCSRASASFVPRPEPRL